MILLFHQKPFLVENPRIKCCVIFDLHFVKSKTINDKQDEYLAKIYLCVKHENRNNLEFVLLTREPLISKKLCPYQRNIHINPKKKFHA